MIKIIDGGTHETIEFLERNLNSLGTLETLTHTRDAERVKFLTVIKGSKETMEIDGGLTSGYGGTGPSGLHSVLLKLGVSESKAENLAYYEGNKEHTFELDLKKETSNVITFHSGSTSQTINFVKQNLSQIGNVFEVEHSRNIPKTKYLTTIKGDEGSIEVTGLGSGYNGTGPSGMVTVLKFLGVDESKAETYTYENKDNEHNFTIAI